MAGQEPLRQFRDVKDAVYRYDSVFASIKSPTEIYEEKLRSLQDRIAQIWSELHSAPPDQTSRLQDNLIELAGQKKELEIDQKTNIEHYERVHAEKLRQTMDSFRDHMFQLMGTSSGQSQFHMTPDTTRLGTDRVESAPVEPAFPELTSIVPVSADDEMDDGPMFDDNLMDDTMEDGADHEPAEDISPQEDSVMQEPVETEPHNEEPIEEPTENPTEDEPFEAAPTNEEPTEEETAKGETVEERAEEEPAERVSADEEAGEDGTEEPDDHQATEPEPEPEPVERESVDDKPIASRTRKPRSRIKASSRDIAARQDIFARQARYTFSPSPTPAAETITVQADESDDEEDDEGDDEEGDEDEDENEDEDKDENGDEDEEEDEDESEEEEDEVSEAEFSEPEEAPPSPRQTRSGGTKRKGNFSSPMTKTKRQKSERASSTSKETQKNAPATGSTRRQTRLSQRHQDPAGADEFKGITDPKCGKVYLTCWDKTKEWLAVLILPMGSFDKIGIPGSIESCGLADSLPPCYQYDKVSGEYTWAKPYETGNSLVNERMFPVMYFDGRDFPNRSAIDWMDAKDLRRFNPKLNNDILPHIKEVERYLKADPARRVLQEDEDGEGVPYKERTESQAPKPEELKNKKKKCKSSEHKTSGSSKAKTNSKKQAPAADPPAPVAEVPKVTPTPEQMAAHRAAALKPQVLRMIGHHYSSDKSKPAKTAASKPATTVPPKSNEKSSNGRPASKPPSHEPVGSKSSTSRPGATNPARPAGKGSNQRAASAHRPSGSRTPATSDPKPTAARPVDKQSNQPAPKPSAAKQATARPAEKNASQSTPKPPAARAVSKPAEKESNQPAQTASAPRPAENQQTNQVRSRPKSTDPRPPATRAASGTRAEKEPSQSVPKLAAPRPAEKESNPPPPKPTEQRPNKPAQTKPQAPVTAEPEVSSPVFDEIQTEFVPQDDEPAPALEDDSQADPIRQQAAPVQQQAASVQQQAAPIHQQASPVQQQTPQPNADPLPAPPPPAPRVPRAPSAPPRHQSVPQPSNVSRPLPVPSPVPRPASTRNPPRPLPGEDVKKETKPIIVIDISDDDSDGATEDNAAAARMLSQRASRAQVLQQLTAALAQDLVTNQPRTTAVQRTDADRLTAVDIALAALRGDGPSNTSARQSWDQRSYDSTHRPVQGDTERTRAPLYSSVATNTSLPDQHRAQMANTDRNIGRQLGSGSLPTPPTQSLPGPMEIDSYSSRPPHSAGPSPISQTYRQPPPEQYAHLQQPQPRQAHASQQQLLTDYTSAAPSHPENLSRRASYDQTPRIPEPPPTTQYWHTQGRLQQTGDPQQSHQNQYQPSQQSHASPVSTAPSIQYPRPDVQQQYPTQQAAPSQYQNTQYQAQQSPAQSYTQSPQAYQQQPLVQYQQPQPAQQYHAAPQPAPTQQYDTQAQTQPVERSTQRTPTLSHLMHRHLHDSSHQNRNQVLPPLPQSSPPIPSAQTHNQSSHASRPSFSSPYASTPTQPPPQAGQLPSVPTVPSQQTVQQTAPLRTSHEWPTAYQSNQVQAHQAGASAERSSSSQYQSTPSSHSRPASGHRQNEQRPSYQPSTHNASQPYASPHWNQQSSSQASNLPLPRPLPVDPQLQQDPNVLPPLVSSNRPQDRPNQSSYNPYSTIASSPQRQESFSAGVHPHQLPRPGQAGASSPPGFSQAPPQQPAPAAAYHTAPCHQVEPAAGHGPSAIQQVASSHEQRALPPRPESSAPPASQPSASTSSNQQAEAGSSSSRDKRDKRDKLNSEPPGNTQHPEPANKFHPWVQVDLNLPQDPPDWGDSMPFELVEFISEWERLRSLRQGLAGLRNHKGGLECLFCNGPERVPYVYDRKNYFEKHLLHHWQRVKKLHPEGPDPTPRPVQRQQQYVFRDGTANLNI